MKLYTFVAKDQSENRNANIPNRIKCC